jgi:DNA repair protein RadC
MLGKFKNQFNMNNLHNVSEVKLTYESNYTGRKKIKVKSSAEVFELMLPCWEQIEYRESFKVLLLDMSNHVLGINIVSLGGISKTIVDIKMVLQGALLANASAIVAVHNHPSGDMKPSVEDDGITNKIKQASKIMDIELIDHLIITKDGYFSYADEGRL